MSNYINVLRRLERERRTPESLPAPPSFPVPTEIEARAPESISSPIVAEPAPSAEPAVAPVPRIVIPLPSTAPTATAPEIAAPAPAPVSPPEAQTVAAAPMGRAPEVRGHDTRRERAFATESHPGIASLLENIRLISNGRSSRMVVFCGASTAEAVSLVATALATHAERSGMRAFVAMLNRTAAGAAIVPTKGANHAALAVDLDAGSVQPILAGWVERIAPGSDLVVLTGPPLATSIDAALLACACDGLVIIAESEVTERAALQVAAERAKIAGCNTLGVVMHGTKNRLPRWLRRLVGDPSETHAPRED